MAPSQSSNRISAKGTNMTFKGHKGHQEALLPLLSILTSTFSHLCATAELAVSLLHTLCASVATPGKGKIKVCVVG